MIYLFGATCPELRALLSRRSDVGLMWSFPKVRLGEKRFAPLIRRFKWAGDNGCFTRPNIDVRKFVDWVGQHTNYATSCLFIVAPDVVGNAKATLERSQPFFRSIRDMGLPVALAAQDGLENERVPWREFDCLFIGGTTEWKLSIVAFELIKEAKVRSKWVHMGRVNSRVRLRFALQSGCDSADGSGVTRSPKRIVSQYERWLTELRDKPFLPFESKLEEEMDCWEWALV